LKNQQFLCTREGGIILGLKTSSLSVSISEEVARKAAVITMGFVNSSSLNSHKRGTGLRKKLCLALIHGGVGPKIAHEITNKEVLSRLVTMDVRTGNSGVREGKGRSAVMKPKDAVIFNDQDSWESLFVKVLSSNR